MALKIAFGHQARVGKDTAADYIIERYGGTRVQMAAGVYELGAVVQRGDPVGLSNYITDGFGPMSAELAARMSEILEMYGGTQGKIPALLQDVGMTMRDHYGENVWIDRALAKAGDATAVVTDMRFPNEFELLTAAGYTTVKIVRPDRPIDRDPTHISETALADTEFQYTVVNNGTLAQFHAAIQFIIDDIM